MAWSVSSMWVYHTNACLPPLLPPSHSQDVYASSTRAMTALPCTRSNPDYPPSKCRKGSLKW